MEAAAVGTPAVAFRVGGLRESVVEGETGLLVDDLTGFVEALGALLGSAPLRDQMGAAARERARLFSWDDTAVAFDEALLRAEAVTAVDAVEKVVVVPAEA
jgi:D-inositol-3-phosphate glycosyltransferase